MDAGKGSAGVPVLCFFSFLTGVGSCAAFGGAMKAGRISTLTLIIPYKELMNVLNYLKLL